MDECNVFIEKNGTTAGTCVKNAQPYSTNYFIGCNEDSDCDKNRKCYANTVILIKN